MTQLIHDTFEIEMFSVFAPAIANGDYSGLETHEEYDLEGWLEESPGNASYSFGEETHYGECEISGYMGDVITLTVDYNFRKKETEESDV